MPRNVQGIYSLPAGNPVVPGTLIESTWANPTMSDIAAALTGSLPRNGSAGMQGPLILAGNASVPLEAVPLQQLNAIVGGSNTYLPAGAIQLFAMSAVPSGWLECNGAAVSRTTYANLFAAIGTTYGAGNGTTTFNLPDLRGMFVRGWDNGRSLDPGRALGSQQAAANNPHTHIPTVSNPAHSHTISDPGHGHTINDPGHKHAGEVGGELVSGFFGGTPGLNIQDMSIAVTGITVNGSATGISVNAAAQATSVSIASEGIEARPVNVAMVYAIKAFGSLQTDGLGSMAFQNKEAVDITGGSGVFTTLQCTTTPTQPNDVARLADIGGSLSAVLSSDPQVLLVDNTTPSTPILRPQTNVPLGMVKLDAAGFVPSSVLNITDLTFLGNWDASPGLLPTGTFVTGDYYGIDVAGTLTLHTSGGLVAQACNVGDQIIYNSATPGWWYSPAPAISSLPASAVTFAPSGTIVATNTQAAVEEVSSDVTALDAVVLTKVDKAGDTMMGQLNGITPVSAANLTRKDYVDSKGVDVVVDSSGIALKFPDGTLVCYISNSVSAGTWTASSPAGYFYASFGGVGNYPVPFIANPALMGFANEQTVATRGMYVANLSTSLAACTGGFYVSPLNTAPASVAAVPVSVLAVGRWKV